MAFEVMEGVQVQSADEIKVRTLDTSAITGNAAPGSPAVTAFDEDNNDTDVTSAVFPSGSPTSGPGPVIVCPALRNLVKGKTYRIEIRFTHGGNTHEPFYRVRCVY